MKITLFKAEEATQLAHELSPQLEQMVAWRAELLELETRLEVLSLALETLHDPPALNVLSRTLQQFCTRYVGVHLRQPQSRRSLERHKSFRKSS